MRVAADRGFAPKNVQNVRILSARVGVLSKLMSTGTERYSAICSLVRLAADGLRSPLPQGDPFSPCWFYSSFS